MVTVGEVLNSVLFVFLQANEENCRSSPCESAEYLQELANLYQSQHGSALIHLIPFSCSMYNVSCKGGNRRFPQSNPCVHRAAPPRVVELGPDVCSHGRKDFCCLLGGVCCSESELHQLNSSWACALGCRHSHCLPCLAHGQSCLGNTDKGKGAHQTSWITTPGCPKASPTSSLWLNFPWYCAFWWCFYGPGGDVQRWRCCSPEKMEKAPSKLSG